MTLGSTATLGATALAIAEHAKVRLRSEWQHRPFGLELGCERCTVATDGHVLLAYVGGDAPDLQEKNSTIGAIEKFFVEATWHKSDMEALMSWLGIDVEPKAPERCDSCGDTKEVQCPRCLGTKRVEHDCGCEYCDEPYEECECCEGAGITSCPDCDKSTPKTEAWNFYGLAMDRNLLRRVLPPVSGVVHIGTNGQMARIVAADWALIVMGLSIEKNGLPAYP